MKAGCFAPLGARGRSQRKAGGCSWVERGYLDQGTWGSVEAAEESARRMAAAAPRGDAHQATVQVRVGRQHTDTPAGMRSGPELPAGGLSGSSLQLVAVAARRQATAVS